MEHHLRLDRPLGARLSRSTAGSDLARSYGDTLREDGARLMARLAEYLETVEERAVSTPRTPSEVAARFDEPLPRQGTAADAVWDDVFDRVFGDAIHLAHPMYVGHQVAPPLPHAALAEAVAGVLNQSTAVWEMSPTGTPVEQQVIRWMIELAGFPDTADGTLVSGGSVANLTGLLAAREAVFPGAWEDGIIRERWGRPAVFAGASSHYSVERALGVMGLGGGSLVAVPGRGHLDADALAAAIREAREQGRTPMAIVATAACTATGSFDDLDAIADVAAADGVWLHVDGAHGASFLASPRLRGRLRGIERADSLAWDPHKMMHMPISASAILVRDHRHLDAAFDQSAPYLFHPRPGEARSGDIAKRTLQCSKRFDALKLWVALRHYGLDHFAALQEHLVDLAASLHQLLLDADDFAPAHEPDSNILCFRWLPPDQPSAPDELDALQQELRERYNASGQGWITTTVLDGRRVLRVTLMNPRTRTRHLGTLLQGLRDTGRQLLGR